jgi:hypothetical protein
MEAAIRLWGQYNLSAIAANHAISGAKPTLGPPNLLDRLVDGGLLPPLPTHGIARVTKLDLLDRDDDDVRAANHQAVTQFFPTFADRVRVRPKS